MRGPTPVACPDQSSVGNYLADEQYITGGGSPHGGHVRILGHSSMESTAAVGKSTGEQVPAHEQAIVGRELWKLWSFVFSAKPCRVSRNSRMCQRDKS